MDEAKKVRGGATTPRKKPPWNCHQPRTPTGNSLPATPRVSSNKENLPDDSVASSSLPYSPSALNPSVIASPGASPMLVGKAGSRGLSSMTLGGGKAGQSMTCSDLLKEVLASATAAHGYRSKQQQQQPPEPEPTGSDCDHVTAIRALIGQLGDRVGHRPDCVRLLAELGGRLGRLEADLGVVTGQLAEENRALRRRARQAEAALAAGRAESAARAGDWGRREAALVARLQAAEAARARQETRAAALEAEMRELAVARLASRPVSAASTGAASAASRPLTADNLARHSRLMSLEEAAATTDDNIDHDARLADDCAVTSVSQQQQQMPHHHPHQPQHQDSHQHQPPSRDLPQQSRRPPPPSASPPTLDSAPARGLPSVPARYPPGAAGGGGAGNCADDVEDTDDEAEFRRGLARIEEQIAKLQTSLSRGDRPC